LQADFASVQSAKNTQKLSERNCIELVLKLIEMKLIDVIHTVDGREYVTRSQLRREMEDEVTVHGGRLPLSDLSATLSMDYSVVEVAALELIANRPKAYFLTTGQLISAQYLDRIAEEVNEELQTRGCVNLAQLTTKFDLTLEFLHSAFASRLGSIIRGQIDPVDKNVIYTAAYLARHHSRVQGALRGLTRPTSVSSLLQVIGCDARIFFSVLDKLLAEKKVHGTLVGGHQETANFVPDVYSKTQDEWVSAFFKQNGYFDYATMSRLGISDPKSYIQRNFNREKLLHLSSVCVGQGFLTAFEGVVEDAVADGTWYDVRTQDVTSVYLNDNDINKLLIFILKQLKIGEDKVKIYDDTIIFCQDYHTKMLEAFMPQISELVKTRAEENAKVFKKAAASASASNAAGNHSSAQPTSPTSPEKDDESWSKDDRRKKGKGGNKGHGGTAREVKMKSTKKKGGKRGGNEEEEDEDIKGGRETMLQLMSKDEMTAFLEEKFPGIPEVLASEVAEELERPLNAKYTEEAKALFVAASGSVADQRKIHQSVDERVNSLVVEIRMYERAIGIVGKFEEAGDTSTSLETQLCRYLMKTLGTEVTNALFALAAADVQIKVEESSLNPSSRTKVANNVNSESAKAALNKLNVAVSENSVTEFLVQTEAVATELQILIKKTDKKKEKQLLQSHRVALMERLQAEEDPSLALHLAVSLAFHNAHQAMIHINGRLIPQVIAFLTPRLDADLKRLINDVQANVLKTITGKMEDEDRTSVNSELAATLPPLKAAIFTMKKGGLE